MALPEKLKISAEAIFQYCNFASHAREHKERKTSQIPTFILKISKMNIRLFPKKDTTAAIWSGGLTYEYMIYPETARYGDRDFLFRISSATIEKVPSEFTKFKGYHRYLVMLDNCLDIEVNKEKKIYEKYEIMEFNSDDEVTSYTKGIDFNWMVSEKIGLPKLHITQRNQNCNAQIVLLFSLHTTVIKINEKPYDLERYDLLVIENLKKENIMLDFSNKCLYGTLESL